MNKEEALTDLGTVRIHKNVIISIAGIAAGEIEGVKRLGKDFKSGLLGLVGKGNLCAIRVDIDKNGEVKLEIPLVVKYGSHIPDIASSVQENVRSALEKMTTLSIKEINIEVQGIEKGDNV
jgi:uncharacterized alkaline shock family protein YloU